MKKPSGIFVAFVVVTSIGLTVLALGVVGVIHPAHACQVAGGMGGMTPCHA